MSTEQLIETALAGARHLADARFGATIERSELVAARARSVVLRCQLAQRGEHPHSIIAKMNTSDDTRGFSDWAALAFLATLDEARGVAPRFYDGDPALRLSVMEDLGPSRTVADLIAADDAPALRRALCALAVPMARLVAATAGSDREARYVHLRAELPGGQEANRHEEARRWRAAWPRAAAWFAAAGCPSDDAIAAAVERVADGYAEPGPFLAFSHGDPAPSNNHIAENAAHLLDFEYAAYRHALYDITGWYVLCPLPEAWAGEMHAEFRRQLDGVWPPLADESGYRAGWATMCAYRALAMLTWLSLDIVAADRPWAEGWTMRGALLTAASRLGSAAAGVAALAPLAEAGERLANHARARWPELGDGLPSWPADDLAHRDRAGCGALPLQSPRIA